MPPRKSHVKLPDGSRYAVPAKVRPAESGVASETEVIARRQWVEELMERGAGAEYAARELAAVCNISVGRAREYVAKVRNEWRALEVQERPARRAATIRMLEEVTRRAIEVGEYLPALKAISEIARITGIYEPEKVEVVHSVREQFEAAVERLDPKTRAALRDVAEKVRAASKELPPAAN